MVAVEAVVNAGPAALDYDAAPSAYSVICKEAVDADRLMPAGTGPTAAGCC